MPLGALGVTALLTGIGWGVWDWASHTGHDTVGWVAGVLMVPAAVAFAGFLLLTVLALAHSASQRAAASHRARGEHAVQPAAVEAPLAPLASVAPSASRDRVAA